MEPPEYEMLLFGMRNGCNEYLADFMEDGREVSETAKYFVAQKYGVVVNITDDSRTKIILKKSGASAPTSYDSKSDSVEGVKVSKTTVTVSENVKFDLYIVDEKNNVTAITGFDLTSIDNKAPDVSLEYELFRDTDGYDVVRVWLVPEGNEEIYTSDKNVMAVIETEKYIDEYGVEDERKLLKYYKEYKENSNEKFTYTDFYGNSGQIAVEVNAIDVTAPVVNSIEWSGIGEYQKPEDVKNAVNKDVIAILKVSKAASTVKFYEYDSSKEDNKGKEITDESIVTVGIAGTTINITRYDVNVTDIDDKQLALKFSTKADGSGAEDNVKNMKLQSGQNLYVMANKAAVISTDSIEKTVSAGQWVEIKLMTESGVTVTDNRDGVINDFNVSGVPDTVKKAMLVRILFLQRLEIQEKQILKMLW